MHCDTIEFFPHSIPFPEVKLKDFLKQEASDIVTLLTQPPSTTVPSLQAGHPAYNILLTLSQLLKHTNDVSNPSSSKPSVANALQRVKGATLPRVKGVPLPMATESIMKSRTELDAEQSTRSLLPHHAK